MRSPPRVTIATVNDKTGLGAAPAAKVAQQPPREPEAVVSESNIAIRDTTSSTSAEAVPANR